MKVRPVQQIPRYERSKNPPGVVDLTGDVVLTVVVSSVVVPTGEVTTFVVMTLTLVGRVPGWSLTGAAVESSEVRRESTSPDEVRTKCQLVRLVPMTWNWFRLSCLIILEKGQKWD